MYTAKRCRIDHDIDDWRDDYALDDDTEQQDDVARCISMRLTVDQTNAFSKEVDGQPVSDITKFWFDSSIQA